MRPARLGHAMGLKQSTSLCRAANAWPLVCVGHVTDDCTLVLVGLICKVGPAAERYNSRPAAGMACGQVAACGAIARGSCYFLLQRDVL